MVCQRCVMTVENILKKEQIPYSKVSLGEVELLRELNETEAKNVEADLKQVGFELITGRTNKIVEDIKQLVMEYIALGMIRNQNFHHSSQLSFTTIIVTSAIYFLQ